MYFTKLNKNIKISVDDFKKLNHLISYGKNVQYFHTKLLNVSIRQVLPEKYRLYFTPLVMEIYNNLSPHVDNGIKSSINFYINSGNCVTQFYDIVEDTSHGSTGSYGGKLYSKECLRQTESFIAKEDEVWLLNVSKPHSVESLNEKPTTRFAICLQTNKFSYNEVADMLKESGYL